MRKHIPENAILIPETARLVFTGEIFDVFQWQQEMYDGSTATFEMLRRADTASVVCIIDGKIIVLDEEQPARGPRRNFPGGRVDPEDSTVLAAAQREVREETGYTFREWRLLKVRQPIAKMEWFIHLFIAWESTGHEDPAGEPGEKITINYVTFDDLKKMVMARAGYLWENQDIFEHAQSIDDLLALPEFVGKEADR